MKKNEMNGMLKGLGIGMILSAAIFYAMVLNLRMTYDSSVPSNEEVVSQARALGMIYRSETTTEALSDEAIIKAAQALGMVFDDQ